MGGARIAADRPDATMSPNPVPCAVNLPAPEHPGLHATGAPGLHATGSPRRTMGPRRRDLVPGRPYRARRAIVGCQSYFDGAGLREALFPDAPAGDDPDCGAPAGA